MKKDNKKRIVSFIIGFAIIIFFVLINSLEKPIVVSKSIIDSIYLENNLSYDDYNNYVNNTTNIDNNITDETLKYVKTITIDGKDLGNSDFLKYAKNIETLTIKNYQNLTKKDLKNLEQLKKVTTLYLSIDGNYVLKNSDFKIDLSIFPKLKTLYITCNLQKEIDSYISYNLIKDNSINSIIFSDDITFDELKLWDSKINNIIKELDLNNKKEEEKLNIITTYIKNTLTYDKEIYNYFIYNKNTNIKAKVHNYNVNLLSSILSNDNKIKSVICCNYAAFTNILLYKVGIESYYITGLNDGDSHSWNYVNIDGNYYFIDLTILDNNYDYELLIDSNMSLYKNYSNYNLPTESMIEEPIYYNTDTAKLVIRFNNKIIKLI